MKKQLSKRHKLIAIVMEFVQITMHLPGVTRIALLGSLTTNKLDPKDADLLVTIEDQIDLTQLAAAGRRLQGRAQSLNRGGDVFLMNPAGWYIGRICPWKECGPGFRTTCDALHCGQRIFLHDDFEAIQLEDDLITSPPVEIYPNFVTRVQLPVDLEEALENVLGIVLETD